jgi:hypothetical protein
MDLGQKLIDLGDCNVAVLGRELLLEWRDGKASFPLLERDRDIWNLCKRTRTACKDLFSRINSEVLDAEDILELVELIRELRVRGSDGLAARAAALALDDALYHRFAGVFSGKLVELHARDVFPVMHQKLPRGASARPENLELVPDQVRHLGVMPDHFEPVAVTLDWTEDHALAALRYGTRVAIGIPNLSIDEFHWDDVPSHRPLFFNVRAKDELQQRERLFEILQDADQGEAMLVVLPELTAGSAAVVDEMEEWLNREKRHLQMIVAGSCHVEESPGVRRNSCTTLVRGTRRRVHHKFSPFSSPAGQEEDLQPIEPSLTIRYSGSWAFVTMICKDLLGAEVRSILHQLRPRLVLVPAMSPKLQPFRASTGDLVSHTQAFVIIANVPSRDGEHAVIGRPRENGDIDPVRVVSVPTLHLFELLI